MKKLFALLFAATLSIACGGSDSLTGSSGLPQDSGTPTASAVAPAPSPSPATPSSTPVGDRPYVTFKEPLGEGEFCNTATHQLTLTVEYWNANNFQKQELLETRLYTAQAKTCVPLPPAKDVVKLSCGEKVYLQVDAATTEHLGHVFVTVEGPEEKETVEVAVTYTEWSACSAPAGADLKEGCFKTRTKITTTTKTYVCKEPVVEVVKVEEKESCTCACVETWVELKPEVTKGEWGACTTGSEGCFQSREVTTIIKEQNSCTQEIRQKSKVVTEEKQECTCPCVEEWKELKPEITYGAWGECKADTSSNTVSSECSRSRTKLVVVKEQNSCTQEIRVKSQVETKESEPCTCPCEVGEFWNQSFETNKNWIKGNVHVRGDGAWSLKLFAASSTYEYPDQPDYTKDVDSKTITCKGQGELKVEYNWKDHSSRYWWIALYKGNTRVWLSTKIDKSAQHDEFQLVQ